MTIVAVNGGGNTPNGSTQRAIDFHAFFEYSEGAGLLSDAEAKEGAEGLKTTYVDTSVDAGAGFNACFSDGHVKWVSDTLAPTDLFLV